MNQTSLTSLPIPPIPQPSMYLKTYSVEQDFPLESVIQGLIHKVHWSLLMKDRGQLCHDPFYDSFVWIQHLHWCSWTYYDLLALQFQSFLINHNGHILSLFIILYNFTSKIKKWELLYAWELFHSPTSHECELWCCHIFQVKKMTLYYFSLWLPILGHFVYQSPQNGSSEMNIIFQTGFAQPSAD